MVEELDAIVCDYGQQVQVEHDAHGAVHVQPPAERKGLHAPLGSGSGQNRGTASKTASACRHGFTLQQVHARSAGIPLGGRLAVC